MSVLDVLIPADKEFDPSCYILANPDLAKMDLDAARSHFDQYGFKEGRKQINPLLFERDGQYRTEKFLQFGKYLNCELSPSEMKFPLYLGSEHFSISDYQSESANDDFGPFVQAISANPGKRYLDLGCGLRRQVHSNCLYLEVYPSVAADVVVPPNCKYPFRNNTFDGIGCFAVLEHTRKPWLVVEEMSRMLKVGGTIWIDWPFLQPVHGYPSHFFNATRNGLRTVFEDAGFAVDQIGTWDHQGPDFTLAWILGSFVRALPEPEREQILSKSLGEILGQKPGDSFWRGLLTKIDDEARSTLACGNCLVATKRR